MSNNDSECPYTRPTHFPGPVSRREFLQRAGMGFGGMALSFLLAEERANAMQAASLNPLAPKAPMFAPKAKSVIFLFMYGGVSHVDTFDPKPELTKHDGLPMTGMGVVKPFFGNPGNLMKSPFQFKKYGKSGMDVSELFPNVAEHVDDMCFVRSLYCDSNNHAPAIFQMNTGVILQGSPSLGSWVTYGLGSVNQNLPAFVVMTDPRGGPIGGAPSWSSGYMPATYQGTIFRPTGVPILDLRPPADVTPEAQRSSLDLLARLNNENLAANPGDSNLEARIASYELAYRMQANAPEVVDMSGESDVTRDLYGLNDKKTETFGRQCLLARRLVERGVRFVQLYSGGGHGDNTWDAHGNVVYNHTLHAGEVDRPIAGLLADLKQRGLLKDTLVVWAGEFGRMPISQGGKGRDHNPGCQTIWMAGGGIKGGTVVGASDELGYKAAESPYHVHDLHATILHQLGMDDMKLTYLHDGRFQRLTVNGGTVIQEALA